jgi:hypothetical protein
MAPLSVRRALRAAAAVVFCVVAFPPASARAAPGEEPLAPAPPETPTAVFVETDPATFVLGGFAVHARVRPAALPHWTLGAGAYALNMPSPMVDIDPANRGEGWSSRIDWAAGLFVDRYFRDDAEGLFVGMQLGWQRFRVARDEVAGEARFDDVLAMPRVGYTWRPFHAGLYVMPWLGVGATARVDGDVKVGGDRYDVLPVVVFATVHAGWRFQ